MVPDNNADGAAGHGFKPTRFAEGELLTGAYGIGSIS